MSPALLALALPLAGGPALAAGDPGGALSASTLQAAVLAFHRDGLGDVGGRRTARLFDEACTAGHALACSAETWSTGPLSAAVGPASAACGQGDGVGCVIAGWAHEAAGDPGPAATAYAAGCAGGQPRACAEQARLAGDGAALARACEAGLGTACSARAALAPAPEDAARWLDLGCDRTDAESCTARAELALRHPDLALPEDALHQLLEQSCKQGHARACHHWGTAHLGWGLGLDRSTITGVDPLVRACDLGLARACGEAGGELVRGRAGGHRVDQGRRVLAQGCEAGDGPACFTLASTVLALQAHGETADPAPLARQACALGAPGACGWLGLAQATGLLGGAPDPAAASATLTAACDAQDADACAILATVRATADDAEGARRARQQACAAGHHGACADLARPPAPAALVRAPATDRPVPKKAAVPPGLGVLRALDARDHALAICARDPGPACGIDLAAQLLTDDARRLGPMPARAGFLAGVCTPVAPSACLAAGQALSAAGDPAGAATALRTGCGPEGLGPLACTALVETLGAAVPTLDDQVALCHGGHPAHCADAAKGLAAGGDAAGATAAAAAGCAAGDKAACKVHKKQTGGPPAAGAGPLASHLPAAAEAPPPAVVLLDAGGTGPGPGATAADDAAVVEGAHPALMACSQDARLSSAMWTQPVEARITLAENQPEPTAVVLRLPGGGPPGLADCATAVLSELRFPAGAARVLSHAATLVQQPPALPPVDPDAHHHHH